MSSTLLLVVFQNLIFPAIFMVFWEMISIREHIGLLEIAIRDLRDTEKSTQQPQEAESKYSKEFIARVNKNMEEIRNNASDYKTKFVRDSYSDLVYQIQLGQYLQIFISISVLVFYYISKIQYISIAILLQTIISSVFGFVNLQISHRYYPREIKILR